MDELDFERYVVSLKDSDPEKVVTANSRFAEARPDVPLHLGVTEAGLPPDGIVKTRLAFEKLLARGIGDTLRVSLTLPNERKHEEVQVGHQIIEDVAEGRFISVPDFGKGLNIISCPSCSRVENESFVELAQHVRELTVYAAEHRITIAVMGCRVNGPGETDDADLGLWCGPTTVNLKKKDVKVGIVQLQRGPTEAPRGARPPDRGARLTVWRFGPARGSGGIRVELALCERDRVAVAILADLGADAEEPTLIGDDLRRDDERSADRTRPPVAQIERPGHDEAAGREVRRGTAGFVK